MEGLKRLCRLQVGTFKYTYYICKVNIINIVRCSLRHITMASVCRISKLWDKKSIACNIVKYYHTQNYCIRPPLLLFVLS